MGDEQARLSLTNHIMEMKLKIKSMLLSSVAAMAVVSSASAADAIIVAEPEPVEYVRVCDAFGVGYFYIPGTETCLKISGEVRMRVEAQDNDFKAVKYNEEYTHGVWIFRHTHPENIEGTGGKTHSYTTSVRGRLNIEAKSDTELGVLHSYIRIQGANDGTPSTDGDALIDQAWMQLGGLFAGYHESAWVTMTNGGASGFGAHGELDGAYGHQQRNMIQYMFTGENIFAGISVEDDGDPTSYTPDVVGRIGGVFGSVTAYGVVAYDQDNGTSDAFLLSLGAPAVGGGSGEWGAKVGVNADIGSSGNLIVQGFYASGPTAYGANYSLWGSEFTPRYSVLGSYQHALTSTVSAHATGQYFADFYAPFGADDTSLNAYAVSGGLSWSPVENFSVKSEVSYTKVEDKDDVLDIEGGGLLDNWAFMMQLQRKF